MFISSLFCRHRANRIHSGFALNKIARRYGVSVSSLAAANGLSWNSWVYSGQRLRIPGGSSPAPAPAPTSGSYVVRRGDTLTSIALRYGISARQLASANGIRWNSWVYVGQRLKIPGQSNTPAPPPASTSGTYIVKAGNTLYSIAKWHGVTVSELKAPFTLARGLKFRAVRHPHKRRSPPPRQRLHRLQAQDQAAVSGLTLI